MQYLKIRITFLLFLLTLFTACVPEPVVLPVTTRFQIDQYTEVAGLPDDVTGVWVVLQSGTRVETKDGIEYTTTGNLRELVEISGSPEAYTARSCVETEAIKTFNLSGDDASVTLNAINMVLTKSSFTRMSGTASSAEAGVSYSAAVNMKKIAALDSTFGTFDFFSDGGSMETGLDAHCMQESDIRVTGTFGGLVQQYTNISVLNATEWTTPTTYKQTAYAYTTSGTTDSPVRTMTFVNGTVAASNTLRAYPESGQTLTVSIPTASTSALVANYSVSTTPITGSANLALP